MADVQWQDVQKAKEFLQKTDTTKNISVYDHLCKVLGEVLSERPDKAIDVVEAYARKAAESNQEKPAAQSNEEELAKQNAAAEQNLKLYEKAEEEEEGGENDEDYEIPLPNLMELAFYFEQAGIGLGRSEIYEIFLHLKTLVFNYPLNSVRFWGKIFGINANYIIAEVEFNEGEGEEEEEVEEENEAEDAPEDDEEGPSEEDELPKPVWKAPPVIPKEEHHSGANKKVYFVCNAPGEEWVKLPHVTPAQIVACRSIKKLLTGNLETPIVAFPPFNGTEANYLRGQIARISASTQISPAGFYMFDEDEEEEEEESFHENYMTNVEFEGISLKDLADPSMQHWVHHTQHILPQGRCTWFNPFEKVEEDFDEDDGEEEEEEETSEAKAEEGPKLLSSAGEDYGLGQNLPAWTTYISSRVLPEYAVAVARSNRWPGAYAFAKGKRFENVYIGWGSKYTVENFTPACPPPPMLEYTGGPEVAEVDDPSVEEERALELRQQEAAKAADEMDQMEEDDEDDE